MLSANTTFALIAPIFLLLLGVSQVAAWALLRRQAALLSQGCAFVLAAVGMLVQIMGWKEPFWSRVLAFASCYLGATALAAIAMAQRFQVRMRWLWLLGMGMVVLGAQLWFTEVQPSQLVRVHALSMGAMLMLLPPLLQWRKMRLSNPFDNAWRWVYVALIVVNVVRTELQLPMLTPQLHAYEVGAFIETLFWLFLYVLLMVVCMCAAGCLLCAVMQDVVDRLEKDRSLDPLTQIANRRGFDELSGHMFAKAQSARQPMPCAVLLCDIDHFKRINDRWGHSVGDAVLQQIARAFQTCSRAGDVVARMGGEEFAVLLQSADAVQANTLAQRMCDEIAAMRLPELAEHRITLSIGVAMLHQPSTEALKDAMQTADQYLYEAKRSGRNRVVSAMNSTQALHEQGLALSQ